MANALRLYASDPRANLRNFKKQSLTHLLVQRDFWNYVEDLEEILRPLHEAQKSSESDGSHLGHVTKRWLNM
ncbi:hypothetical protein OEA41_001746 [Lepraria neglecta]|uniref:Uncharacterized protein n=1 Tax=Lepraria neglecta TaxID=209136 RepID=A0AAD9ZAN4_9LECA|nr:hypothetical protein OEA41_001746 [Lepraria neglecta]